MISTFTATARQQNTPSDVANYESLRREVVEQHLRTGNYGLAVLVRQGLAAWIEQWSKIPVSLPTQLRRVDKPCPLPNDTSGEVVNVLVAMTLGRMKEVHT